MQATVAADKGEIVGVVITEVHTLRSGGVYLHVISVAGDSFAEWSKPMNELLQTWAKTLGAKFISTNGRRGLEKLLEPLGWRKQSVVMVCDIGEENE